MVSSNTGCPRSIKEKLWKLECGGFRGANEMSSDLLRARAVMPVRGKACFTFKE